MKTIKNIASFLLMLTVVMLLTSCSKDPEIYGKWKLVSLTATDGVNSETFPMKNITFEFQKNGHYIMVINDEEGTGEYTVHGNNMVFKNLYSETIYEPQSTTVNHYDVSGIIKTLTKTELSIELFYDEEVLEEMEEEIDIHVIVDFERL